MNDSTTNKPAEHSTSSVVKLAPSSRVIGQSPSPVTLRPVNGGPNFIRVPNQVQGGNYLPFHLRDPDSAVLLPSKKIPRPPNAFMMFANEWRKKLAIQHPAESNKSISVRLGQLWKNMGQNSKDVYFQLAKEAGRDHKKKYPGYVYNPKEARMRKALREQSRGSRSTGNDSQAGTRWPKYAALTMNHQRQSLLSPVLLQHSALSEDSKSLLQEPDSSMLQSYPDYLELPYNVPSTDYSTLDNQSWYPYIQSGAQSNGGYMERTVENKLPIDWSTPYNSEQGNFIRASPQSSPYSMQNHQEIPSMLMNGEHSSGSGQEQTTPCEANCLAVDCKPVIDQLICQNTENCIVKDPEQQVKELLASAKVIPENSPVLNGGTSSKQENHIDSNSTRLPGFHQAFGSTEIGRFSQPDGFFEAAVAAENERKVNMSPLPPPPKRGRGSRGGRKAKSRMDPDLCFNNGMGKKEWPDWSMQSGCDSLNSLQRMNCYPYHHEEQRMNPYPDMYQQWHPHSESPYYPHPHSHLPDRNGQYYPPYYTPQQEPSRSYQDCYGPYEFPHPAASWRHPHPYYHPSHFPPHAHGYYQQYSEYRQYGYQNNRWAVNREVKYSSGLV